MSELGAAETESFPSTSPRRTQNNVMRHEYRVLNDTEKAQMKEIKDAGMAFLALLHAVGGTMDPIVAADVAINRARHPMPERLASRELSIAATKLEEVVMWATKHVTR